MIASGTGNYFFFRTFVDNGSTALTRGTVAVGLRFVGLMLAGKVDCSEFVLFLFATTCFVFDRGLDFLFVTAPVPANSIPNMAPKSCPAKSFGVLDSSSRCKFLFDTA